MRIVQTFWTGGRSPKEHSFGWLHPEYNLMSWALSCLSLREHYDEVVLYTDKEGYKVLIEELQLPYTEVHVEYDEHLCLPQHWAYSKIKTYSLQTEPFLHIDGDIYLPKPLPEDVMNAPLVVQNSEIGTIYYKSMIDNILSYPEIKLPSFVKKRIQDGSWMSYNMGIFGGTNINFIQRYCKEVFRFMESNRINDKNTLLSSIDCNVFFEQIFFACLSNSNRKQVSCLIQTPVQDNGYTINDFCDLNSYGKKCYFHILGGHKTNKTVLDMLEKAMLREDALVYKQIVSSYPERFPVFNRTRNITQKYESIEKCISQYEDFVNKRKNDWYSISEQEMLEIETKCANFTKFSLSSEKEQMNMWLYSNPYLSNFHIPIEWNPKAVELLKQRLSLNENYPLKIIGIVPSVGHCGTREVVISDMGKRISATLKKYGKLKYGELQKKVICHFNIQNTDAINGIKRHVLMDVLHMLNSGVVLLGNDKK